MIMVAVGATHINEGTLDAHSYLADSGPKESNFKWNWVLSFCEGVVFSIKRSIGKMYCISRFYVAFSFIFSIFFIIVIKT